MAHHDHAQNNRNDQARSAPRFRKDAMDPQDNQKGQPKPTKHLNWSRPAPHIIEPDTGIPTHQKLTCQQAGNNECPQRQGARKCRWVSRREPGCREPEDNCQWAIGQRPAMTDRGRINHATTFGASRSRMWSSRICFSSAWEGAWVKRHWARWVLGNAMTSRIESAPVMRVTRRSRPKASPP